jgi:hypothetical protein
MRLTLTLPKPCHTVRTHQQFVPIHTVLVLAQARKTEGNPQIHCVRNHKTLDLGHETRRDVVYLIIMLKKKGEGQGMLRVGHRGTAPSADTIKEEPRLCPLLYSISLFFWRHSVVFVHINIISTLAV